MALDHHVNHHRRAEHRGHRADRQLRGSQNRSGELVVICMSSKLSGTCQSAMIAAAEFPGQVHVIDSLSVCIGQRILLGYGLTLAKQGMDARQICDCLNEQKQKIRVLALLDTLEYLKKGGRISAATAIAGSLLSIKPVIAIENGEVVMAGKARGSKQASNLLRQMIDKVGGVDFSRPYALAYSGLSDTMVRKYADDSADIWLTHTDKLPISRVGCVIGAHTGPGTVAVAFFQPGFCISEGYGVDQREMRFFPVSRISPAKDSISITNSHVAARSPVWGGVEGFAGVWVLALSAGAVV